VCVEPGKKGSGTGPAQGLVMVWHAWLPSRLSLEGTGPYLDLLGHNRLPMVPEV
jgi:hypothetical protein